MANKLQPHFDVWIPALRSGLISLADLVAWADVQILNQDQPPYWLLDLSLATNLEGVYKASLAAMSFGQAEQIPDAGVAKKLQLGMLFERYLAQRLSINDLLLEAGKLVDPGCPEGVPECEVFFELLNQIEASDSTTPQLLDQLHQLFAPLHEFALPLIPLLPARL